MSLAHPSGSVTPLRDGSPPGDSGRAGLGQLRVPESLEQQLLAYRRRIRIIKMAEAVAIAAFAWLAGFLCVYVIDRLLDTPTAVRGGLLIAAVGITAVVPLFVYRWVWRRRGLEQLARLLRRKLPGVGDQLLGVIELTHSAAEQSRSLALCQAAMRQVAADARGRSFLEAVPPAHHRLWTIAAATLAGAAALLAALYPAASANALTRFTSPWGETPRYTFTVIDPVPDQWVVAHGEPATLAVSLNAASQWQPPQGELQLGSQSRLTAPLVEGRYEFAIPAQISAQSVTIHVGDVSQRVRLEPTLRPSLVQIAGDITLPSYLGRTETLRKDVRGGAISLVKGSRAAFVATANRELASGNVSLIGDSREPTRSEARQPQGAMLSSGSQEFQASQTLQFDWQDRFGLAGREPFSLAVAAVDDEAPTLICEGLPRQAVVLDSELLKFKVRAHDDFGIRRLGLMWRALSDAAPAEPAEGERLLTAGGHEVETLDALGTFSAKAAGIEPQPIELFVWAEDYLPGRQRVFSPPHVLYVLTPDQHAIWVTEQLSKWHRQALEVRDRELQLYAANKELRDLPPEQRESAETRRRIERQASAEKSNGRRLEGLNRLGDELLLTAARNPEIGVGHLDRWAEMLQILKDISANRMPSVADLLTEAAEAPPVASASAPPSGLAAGQSRAAGSPPPTATDEDQPVHPSPRAPQIVDLESSQNSPNEDAELDEPGPPKSPGTKPLRLPVTTLVGKGKAADDAPSPATRPIEQAVEEQKDLLAEFERIADELNTILANLEGSTLVKRLKAASRVQDLVAGRIGDQLAPAFGTLTHRLERPVQEVLDELATQETESSRDVSLIMDDMAAYFERRRFAQFKTVLDEMRDSDVIGGLRELSAEIPSDQGLSLAQCEYWSDTLDRWAEDLVDPACSGQCPGGKSPDSLPPSIVLEVLQILEAEVNLREETRVAEQAKAAQDAERYRDEARRLAEVQTELDARIMAVGKRIEALPDSELHFGKELALLAEVDQVMQDAMRILASPDTGPTAIAAETEVIELLLRSKRINPKGGGGGGSAPGGGGTGTTTDSALALLGTGVNQREVRQARPVAQTTGETGNVLPEEFRVGLDEYFNQLEQGAR